ncbi:MAG: EAL domain-containing protein [Ilumatobacteraceae bacterium]
MDTDGHNLPRPQRLSSSAAGRRTMALAAALVVVSSGVVAVLHLESAPGQCVIFSWWSIALVAIVAEMMEFHVEFRRELYSFTFSEIALVIGLFFATPRNLLIGRLIGEAVFLLLRERQPLRKVALNLAAFLGEVTVLLAVHQALGRPIDIAAPSTWMVALLGVALADLLGYLVVYLAVRWHGAPIKLRSILGIGALTIPVNTSFALVVGILIVKSPWATVLLTGIAAFLLVSYRSYTALSQRFESLTMLYEFTRLVSGAQRPDSVLEAILTQAKNSLRAERAEIWLTDDRGAYQRLQVDDHGRSSAPLEEHHGASVSQWMTSVDGAVIAQVGSATLYQRELVKALNANDAIVAPITESGEIVGLVAVVNRLGEVVQFKETDRTMFATLANHASVALENGRLIDRLHEEARRRRHEAMHDALTGLPNRVLFGSKLREQLKARDDSGQRLAVAVMDLDGFKEINDTLGHQIGDVVLCEVAHRISHAVGDAALVARLGGDEFALLFTTFNDRDDLELTARRVRDEVAKKLYTEGMQINVTVSIGFAVAPDDADDAATLLQRADVAMYSAKSANGSGIDFYEALRDENSPRRLTLSTDLRSAIEQGALTIAYQPQVRIADSTMVAVEALARWRHPIFGHVPPAEFIPLAERTGLISTLTVAILRSALLDARRWLDAGHQWTLAVNIAVRNLLDPDFVATVSSLLDDAGVDPGILTLEITETGVMSDASRTIEVLGQLAKLGVRLSVDDFGTGYSSLSYLQQLPVTEIKIDQVFVSELAFDPNAEAIVRSVLDLARNLGLDAVAEGVEDRAAWERLRALGCSTAQGYFLSRPMAVEELAGWATTLPEMNLLERRRPTSRMRATDQLLMAAGS